ncbi:EcsC family protein [Mesobacillus maritimus]|uniref:EcsC family protein n=1 Tax=Mesobacillus maritimus TaxID=1643336 RepID=UPI00204105C1|nr:EcsC family protein [Mesobacillus maritimus]MCM3588428.1 EcsC family protein [Mesobacillus maritimus]
METRDELLNELTTIEKWEKDQKGLWFWERLGRLPFKMLDKLTPKFIQEKISLLLDELGNYIQNGGRYLSNEKRVLKLVERKTGTEVNNLADLQQISVKDMKELSLSLADQQKKVATAQGAGTGIGGLFTLAIDIPALLTLSLKTLQDIAILHGYDPNDRKERIFILKCLQFSSSDIVGKEAILNELSSYGEVQSQEMISQLQGWREVTVTYMDQFGWKKLLQMIPIAGILFGAFANRSMIHDVAESGIMLYQKRKILERLEGTELI